jgi:5-formyltetrahydrofolate cyclo-ligase
MMPLDKQSIRKEYLAKRNQMNEQERIDSSIKIASTLFAHPIFQKAKNIAFYVSKDSEVETILFIEEALKNNKRIYVPRVEKDTMNFYRIRNLSELKEGAFHVFEPTTNYQASLDKLDLIIVPLVAFNEKKYRIGYGKAFYDKYLKDYKGKTVGLAFSSQKTDIEFQEETDISLDYIITENNIYK